MRNTDIDTHLYVICRSPEQARSIASLSRNLCGGNCTEESLLGFFKYVQLLQGEAASAACLQVVMCDLDDDDDDEDDYDDAYREDYEDRFDYCHDAVSAVFAHNVLLLAYWLRDTFDLKLCGHWIVRTDDETYRIEINEGDLRAAAINWLADYSCEQIDAVRRYLSQQNQNAEMSIRRLQQLQQWEAIDSADTGV